MFIIGGLMSVFLSYFLNKFVVDLYGDKAVVYGVPIIEESSKTIIGYIFGSIIGTHFIFGIVESLNDFIASPKEVNFRASVLSIITHLIFGAIAYYILIYVNIYASIIITSIIHGYWNRFMLR